MRSQRIKTCATDREIAKKLCKSGVTVLSVVPVCAKCKVQTKINALFAYVIVITQVVVAGGIQRRQPHQQRKKGDPVFLRPPARSFFFDGFFSITVGLLETERGRVNCTHAISLFLCAISKNVMIACYYTSVLCSAKRVSFRRD